MKQRLDTLVFERGLAPTRARAKALVMEGVVLVNGQREDKPGTGFSEDVHIELVKNPIPYVSRGGLKIQKAIEEFGINVADVVAMDVGASTGGFTDCLLQHGARKVYAIDVGYGQLAYSLRTDDRVVVMERTNIRNIEPGSLDPKPTLCVADVSFISLKKVLEAVESVMAPEKTIVTLIKPQFEAGKENVGKGGVVRDKEVHKSVVADITNFFTESGYNILGLTFSPIKGPKGNIEYLIYVSNCDSTEAIEDVSSYIEDMIFDSHKELD